jgi:hypothetical protein
MSFDFWQIGPFLIAILLVFLIYRRFRRNFGQQPLRPVRMGVRILLLLVVGCLLLPSALHSAAYLYAVLGGFAAGIALGVWGAARTRFVRAANQLFYVPHTYTGMAVSFLFLGRLIYRLVQAYGNMHAAHPAGPDSSNQTFAPASMLQNPPTLGLFFVLMGYYVCYYSIVLWISKRVVADEAGLSATLGEPEKRV